MKQLMCELFHVCVFEPIIRGGDSQLCASGD